jgi:hypothetical protein
VQTWDTFLEQHARPHLVVGWTRNVNRWRDESFFQLIAAQNPSGRYASKRGFDLDRGRYLVLAAFEDESDAKRLSDALGAEKVDRLAGFASQRGFKYSSKLAKTLIRTLRRPLDPLRTKVHERS